MLEVDDYLKLAASNFEIAEAQLSDAEDSLHILVRNLESCLERLRKLRQDELLLSELDALLHNSQTDSARELYVVNS